MTFEAGDVIVVPFPFSDLPLARPRPALVLSSPAANADAGETVLAMITTAARSSRASDVSIADLEQAGLKAACVVRGKLFSLDTRLIARRVGVLSAADRTRVRAMVSELMAI